MVKKAAETLRYGDEELQEFKILIEEKIAEAEDRLTYYLQQLSEHGQTEDAKVRGLDDGLNTIESERLSTMASRQKKLINHLRNALIRIENKTYGICRSTGALISKERLKAVPHATLSIKAKEAAGH
ncbi:MAG TPA: TraR/DksA family transcriptional regulator [Saprospiraceae bacterium]|nr:TraR/DksA family transcriptional regulator [Saprospiraceae bacterium]